MASGVGSTGRPDQTWLITAEDDLVPLNFSLAMARGCALDTVTWRQTPGGAKAVMLLLLLLL